MKLWDDPGFEPVWIKEKNEKWKKLVNSGSMVDPIIHSKPDHQFILIFLKIMINYLNSWFKFFLIEF
jgi:hypothetical protein